MKQGSDKAPLTIVPRAIMDAVASGLLDGEIRCGYIRDDWRNSDVQIFKDALVRHVTSALCEGERIDPDSQIDHLAKAAANLAIILTLEKYEFQQPNGPEESN